MGIGRKITESFRKMAGPSQGDRPAMEIYLSNEAVALWNEEVGRWTDEDMAAQARMVQERVSELARRVESLRNQPPALPLVRELLVNTRELATLRASREQRRLSQLNEGTRTVQRTASEHELKHHHLHDEIQRCRELILQECRRRNFKPAANEGGAEAGLHAQLFQLLQSISRAGSKRMQSVSSDPLLVELEALLQAENPADVERFPEWLRKPAAKLIAVVQERNRYKRLLKSRGLLPDNA